MTIRVKFDIVDDSLLRKLEAYPDELLLHLTDAAREITQKAAESSKKLAPFDSGELYRSIGTENPSFHNNVEVHASVVATADHAYEVHETFAPAGPRIPASANLQRGGKEGPAGGWFFKRVFDDARNLKEYNDIVAKVTRESWSAAL